MPGHREGQEARPLVQRLSLAHPSSGDSAGSEAAAAARGAGGEGAPEGPPQGRRGIWPLRVVYTPLLSIWTWVGVHLPWPATLWFSQQPCEQEDSVSHRLSETQELKGQVCVRREKVPPLRKILKAFGAKQVFKVQIRIPGKTGGCENKFLKDISRRLSWHAVSLEVKEFRETSEDLLLLFCPIASCMHSNIGNALEGLSGKQKVLLVVMHYVQKDNPGTPLDAKHRVTHPAVVRTVYTRYTLKDGFYACKMNEAAVADVADAIKALSEDQ